LFKNKSGAASRAKSTGQWGQNAKIKKPNLVELVEQRNTKTVTTTAVRFSVELDPYVRFFIPPLHPHQ
jgi:hypothetical protein